MAKANFFPLALLAFLGLLAGCSHVAADLTPGDCPSSLGYGPYGLPSGETKCIKNGNMEDAFPLTDAPAVTSCGAVWLNIVEFLAQNKNLVYDDLRNFMSEEAFIVLSPALTQVYFPESVDTHAIVAQALSHVVRVADKNIVLMDILLDTWGGLKVRFSSVWGPPDPLPGRKLLAAAMRWRLMMASDVIVF